MIIKKNYKIHESLKWFWFSLLIWILLVLFSFIWNVNQSWNSVLDQGYNEARMTYLKELSYRIWGAEHGGVYVPVTKATQPNPYLKVPHRDVVTTDGKNLTLINPAYMTRMVFTMSEKLNGVKGHITSLDFINPDNSPDDWERKSLIGFEKDLLEISEYQNIDGKPFVRFMRPMIIQKPCLKCHEDLGYKIGDIRGGISVSVPIASYIVGMKSYVVNLTLWHLLFLFIGSGTLIFAKKSAVNYLKAKEQHATELGMLQNYLSNIIDSMPSILTGVDANGRVTQWNKTAESVTGIDADIAKGKFFYEVFPHMASDMDKIVESIYTRKVIVETNMPHSIDGETYYEDITIYPLISNGVEGAVIRIDDVTKEHELQKQLNHSRKMDAIGQLAGGVAHDFNNILSGIMGASELLKLKIVDSDKKGRQLVDMIMQASMRAADLTSKLLTFGRKRNIIFSSINIHDILDESIAILQQTVDKKIQISLVYNAENDVVFGDSSELQNMILNLCLNASHVMPGGGNIFIETKNIILDGKYCEDSTFSIEPGEYIEIEVKDTGFGIPKENINKIFEPFFTTKEQGKGTGLGLAAVYGTVQNHKGSITVVSEIDVGTSFYILFLSSRETTTFVENKEKIILGTGKVLLVDDEEIIRSVGKLMLEEMGYDVLLAKNGKDAVDIFKVHYDDIDVVLMDIIMPVMSGEEAFHLMKEIKNNCKIIMSSGFIKDESSEGLEDLGMEGFIHKPYQHYELSKLLSDVILG